MHLDDEQIQRLLHGELRPGEETSARRHLAECGACEGRVVEAQREDAEVYALLRHVDHGVPKLDVGTVAAAARRRPAHVIRWAATIILAFGVAGVAYAIPGSPLRKWVTTLTHRPAPAPQVRDTSAAGIAVAPGVDFVVRFARPSIGQIDVLLTDDGEVEVRALTGSPTFNAGTDRLVVDAPDALATFEVRIPRDAPRVQIVLGDTRIVLKEGSRIVTQPAAHCRSETPMRYVCAPRQ